MVGHETAGVLVDTSAWIEALRTDGDAEVRADVRSVVSQGAALFCDIVLLELWNGADGKAEVRLLADLERDLDCVETTVEVWSTANAMARACREKGTTVPATDLLIAACAETHGLLLLHHDAHFDAVAQATRKGD